MSRGTKGKRYKRKYRLKPRFYILSAAVLVLLLLLMFKVISGIIGSESREIDRGGSYKQGFEIMAAAKGYINTPGLRYDGEYFQGGYPPKEVGVCTDVVWNGLAGINVDLKQLIDNDVKNNFEAYTGVIAEPDPHIDFRYVPVQKIYFDRHLVKLSLDPGNVLDWQPGDIVVYENDHVAVVSLMRNPMGHSYVIQHGKDPAGDEDRLLNDSGLKISGHYRWPETGGGR